MDPDRENGPLYRIHEFAQIAGVTVKALHHYDRLGLLKPRRTGSGYRIYEEQDLARLEQIVALKFLGLPLKQINILLDRDPLRLPEALRMQRNVLEEKRRLLDRAICAIGNAEKIIASGKPPDAAVLKQIIEAIEMQTEIQDATEFMKNYYREDAWASFKARHRDWPSHDWNDLFRDIESSLTEDPSSPTAQALAARWRKLRVNDAGGDPKVHGGLLKAWNDRKYWPAEVQNRFSDFDLDRISSFISTAFASYRRARYGEIAWSGDLRDFTPEEKGRFALSVVDLHLKIGESLDTDPASEAGQALAARWMELIESRTGGRPDFKASSGSYESYLRWMDSWPAPIHQKIRALVVEKAGEFILRAISQPI
jgi:MerR family transcriptional regulator, thiopeptide resistance regulator